MESPVSGSGVTVVLALLQLRLPWIASTIWDSILRMGVGGLVDLFNIGILCTHFVCRLVDCHIRSGRSRQPCGGCRRATHIGKDFGVSVAVRPGASEVASLLPVFCSAISPEQNLGGQVMGGNLPHLVPIVADVGGNRAGVLITLQPIGGGAAGEIAEANRLPWRCAGDGTNLHRCGCFVGQG